MKMITPKVQNVKPGTVITFVYGPGDSPEPKYAREKGKAYGVYTDRFYTYVRVKMEDGTFKTVMNFNTVGIGAYCWAE